MTNWKVTGLFTFIVVFFLGFFLTVVVELSENVVYPIDDMGATSVENVLFSYVNPWFVLFELPFVVISAVVGLAIGSRTMSKGWKVVGGWTVLALTLLGGCMYTVLSLLTYDWLYRLAPQNMNVWPLDSRTFIQLTIANARSLSIYFWTAFVFIVLGVGTGLFGAYLGRPRDVERCHFRFYH